MSISITVGTIEDALLVEQSIPEFGDTNTVDDYRNRLGDKPQLILIAKDEDIPVGYKVGYELQEGIFYSWLGGITPSYRRMGLAQQLLEMQETWAQHHGYKLLRVKSMNRFPGMLILLINNRYEIVDLEQESEPVQTKIVFQKQL